MPLRNFKLTLATKRHVVMALAQRVRHDDIVASVQEQFDISIHKRAIAHYTPHNERLAPELKELYRQTQENYWNNVKAEAQERCERRDQEDQRQREVERAKLKQEILDKFNNS